MSKTTELMAKLTERLADPDRLDDSREAVMAAISPISSISPIFPPPHPPVR